MLGTLSVIGIGPGDPELLTLKAARIIKDTEVLCVPRGREEGSSLALSQQESCNGHVRVQRLFPAAQNARVAAL